MTFKKKPKTIGVQSEMPTQEILPPKKEVRNKKGQFLPGNSAGGRTKGSRNQLAESFIRDVLADWEEHGVVALEACREEDPATYLRVVASIVPKEFNIRPGDSTLETYLAQFSSDQIEALLAGLAALGAGNPDASGKGLQVASPVGSKPNGVHQVLLPSKGRHVPARRSSRPN